jgi:hypothetical protein
MVSRLNYAIQCLYNTSVHSNLGENSLKERYSSSEQKAWLDYQKTFDEDSSEPVLNEDWREKAYSAKEQLVDAFVEDDPVFTLVAHGKVRIINVVLSCRGKLRS